MALAYASTPERSMVVGSVEVNVSVLMASVRLTARSVVVEAYANMDVPEVSAGNVGAAAFVNTTVAGTTAGYASIPGVL